MLLYEAFQIAASGLTKVWRVRLLDETAKPGGSLKDVAWYICHGNIAIKGAEARPLLLTCWCFPQLPTRRSAPIAFSSRTGCIL